MNKSSKASPKLEKPTVVHVLYSGLGGHSAVLFALLEAGFMRNAHHQVLFVGVESPPAAYLSRCNELKVPLRYLHKVAGKGHLAFLIALTRELAARRPSMLFLHGLVAMPAVVLLRILRKNKGVYVLVRETQANHLKSTREWLSLALAHRYADKIVHLTTEAEKGSKKRIRFLIGRGKVAIVPNGLDTDFYSPIEVAGSEEKILRIGMQSRLQHNKDHETLIKAFAILCDRYPHRRFNLHIAGDGVTYSKIQEMVLHHGLTDVVFLHGMLDQLQLRDFLRALDIYVHATHGETMSTAIMQALSCGLPVVASDVAGVSNMVCPDSGILYRPSDPIDLAAKLSELVCNADAAMEWRSRARDYAVKHYAISGTVSAYEALIPGFDFATKSPKS